MTQEPIQIDFSSMVVSQPTTRKITRLAFISRFTDEEAVAIDLASIGSNEQAAYLRRYMSKVNAAQYIDLDGPVTRSGVIALETVRLLAVGRALEILDTIVKPEEQYRA